MAWYIPLAVLASWLIINPIYLAKAVNTMTDDEAVPGGIDIGPSDGSEIRWLRTDVDQLMARLGA